MTGSIIRIGAMAVVLATVVAGDAGGSVRHPPPGHVHAAAAGRHSIQLVWTAPVGALRYGVWKQGRHVATTQRTAHTFHNLSCEASYRLGVRALYRGGRSATRWVSAKTGPCPPPGTDPPPPCSKFADPGHDLRSFVADLAPGDVGCLASGTYAGRIAFLKSNVTLREAPGATAECSPCEVEIKDSANSVTWDGIGLNATGYPLDVIALHIYGDDALVENSEIQNRQDICVIVGSHTYGVAHRPRLIHNRIHNCGANHVWNEQTIYLEATRGARVEDNTLYKAWDFGISMYDDAQDSVISHNVIDGAMLQAGVVFGSTDAGQGYCSVNNNNVVRDNIITNNGSYAAMDNPTGCRDGTGNVVRHNCISDNRYGDFLPHHDGFTAIDNIDADPLYVSPASGDYSLLPGSPCAAYGPRF